jgi:hypothetical protein
MVVIVQKNIEKSIAEFYQWIARRDGRFAHGTLSSEYQIAQHRDIVPGAQSFLTEWAV